MTTKPSGRGGWRGGGRPRADPAEKLHPVSLSLTDAQRAKLKALGGGAWLRARIDAAPDSSRVEPVTTRASGDDERTSPRPERLNEAQKARLHWLGGSSWLRAQLASVRMPRRRLP